MLFSFRAARRLIFRTVSQTNVNYRGSALSHGQIGPLHGGDRLPWVKPAPDAAEDNFSALKSLDWQLHVYGQASAEVRAFASERKLPLHVFPWRAETAISGLRRDALYLIRPDGYIAVATDGNGTETIRSYLGEHRFVPV